MPTLNEQLNELHAAAELRMSHLKALYRGYVCTNDELDATAEDLGYSSLTTGFSDDWQYDARATYALEWNYTPSDEDGPGYWRLLLSCGGPQEEIRFYGGTSFDHADFHLMNWGTNDRTRLHGDAEATARAIFEEYEELGMVEESTIDAAEELDY